MKHAIFDELFVLELANNHLGDVDRGIRIVREHARVVRANGVRAAIKLQLRDVDRFIHRDYRQRNDVRYIGKTLRTRLNRSQHGQIAKAIRESGCLLAATPFDEASVDFCGNLRCDVVKVASSDINDWPLIEAVAKLRLPTIASTGGSSLKDVDDLVAYFANRGIPLALNHCVSIYPSEDRELDINQVDFLRMRYPDNVVGFSTHEHTSWDASIMLAYAKGARTFERHIDIHEMTPDGKPIAKKRTDGLVDVTYPFIAYPISPYCSTPTQVDYWFKAFKLAKEMCGGSRFHKRTPPAKEVEYLDSLVRGVWAKRDLPAGYVISHAAVADDFYLAIPLLKGQLSCRELLGGEVLSHPVPKDTPLMVDDVAGMDGPVADMMRGRGLEPSIHVRFVNSKKTVFN
ncbi:MAG: N-acetylneuraminate synthase family protein [Patescibacteria group bacterium]|nr:N-acetylneuraminate synthase family protein [Patescibacteria group bacterium]